MYAFERRLTCRVPSGSSPAATPSGSPVDVPGMFHASQCVMSFFDPLLSTGSGSCMSSTKLCVPGGPCDHFNSGDGAVGPPACVYLSGMTPPSSHAEDVMISGGVAGPRPPPRACPPPADGVCCVCAPIDAIVVSEIHPPIVILSTPRILPRI